MKLSQAKQAAFLVIVASLISGCTGAGGARLVAELPPQTMPQDVKTCMLALYGPPAGAMTERETALYIAGFNRHDLAKTQCGRRAIAWAEGHSTTPR